MFGDNCRCKIGASHATGYEEKKLTRSTSGMSRPRAATSVATSAVNLPFLKFLSTCSR